VERPRERFKGLVAYAAHVSAIFRQQSARYFTLLVLLIYMNQASYGFALLFLNRELHMGVDPTVATIIAYVSQSVLLMAVGVSLDRLGRLKTVAGYMTVVMIANLVILTAWKGSYIVVFAAYGMYALFISMVKVRLANDIVPVDQRLDAVIVANIAGVAVNALLSLAYGWIVDATGSYRFMFIISAASVLALYAVAWRLHREIKLQGGALSALPVERGLGQ
jgi:MFS family permease